jgi:hypothetical protein
MKEIGGRGKGEAESRRGKGEVRVNRGKREAESQGKSE